MGALLSELTAVLNRHSAENESNTPDYILADFLYKVLYNLDTAINKREEHYGRKKEDS